MIRYSRLRIQNPKRESEAQTGRASWYPYYAGFSQRFAEQLIASADMELASTVSDPWNGSGTTTSAAVGLGHDTYGYDLNPVMVLAARARMLSKREKNSLVPIALTILRTVEETPAAEVDPLATWFELTSANAIRRIERSIQQTLVSADEPFTLFTAARTQEISDLAAFFYVAMFRATRNLVTSFIASNPTWLKKPKSERARLKPSLQTVSAAFLAQVQAMERALVGDPLMKDSQVKIAVGSSDSIPLPDSSVDFVLSSPPYCTRIDYAVATQIELAVLGYRAHDEFDQLRRALIGTSTVPIVAPEVNAKWGKRCTSFLNQVALHPSKASATYYLKSHLQYFDSMFHSFGEIARTLKDRGACVLVVQDSYYKEVHNDLPKIVIEMCKEHSLFLRRKESFQQKRTMAGINPHVRTYRTTVDTNECVLCFSKN